MYDIIGRFHLIFLQVWWGITVFSLSKAKEEVETENVNVNVA